MKKGSSKDNEEVDDEQVKEIIKALQQPGGADLLKKLIAEQLPEEMTQPLGELIDGKKLTVEQVMDKVNDNILDSYNAGKITKKEMKLMMGGKVSKKDIEKIKKNRKK